MSSQHKTRLLGAAVLIALAVIVVPFFFPHPTDDISSHQDIDLFIPSEPDFEEHEIAVDKDNAKAQNSVNKSAPSNANNPSSARSKTTGVIEGAQGANQQHETPIAGASGKSTSDATSETNDSKSTKTADKATKPSSKDTNSAKGNYSISLGAYADQANIKHLQNAVKSMGYTTHTQKVSGSNAVRVIAGPFTSQSEADKAHAQLQKQLPKAAVGGVLSTSSSASTSASNTTFKKTRADAPKAPAKGGFAVQMAAYGDASNANKFKHDLQKAGYKVFVSQVKDGDGKTWYRVRVGPYTSKAEANTAHSKLKQAYKDIASQVVAN